MRHSAAVPDMPGAQRVYPVHRDAVRHLARSVPGESSSQAKLQSSGSTPTGSVNPFTVRLLTSNDAADEAAPAEAAASTGAPGMMPRRRGAEGAGGHHGTGGDRAVDQECAPIDGIHPVARTWSVPWSLKSTAPEGVTAMPYGIPNLRVSTLSRRRGRASC